VTYAAGGALVTSGGDIEIPRGKIATACNAGCNHSRCFEMFVRFWPIVDIRETAANVRFRGVKRQWPPMRSLWGGVKIGAVSRITGTSHRGGKCLTCLSD
jgi:hypothetical protein